MALPRMAVRSTLAGPPSLNDRINQYTQIIGVMRQQMLDARTRGDTAAYTGARTTFQRLVAERAKLYAEQSAQERPSAVLRVLDTAGDVVLKPIQQASQAATDLFKLPAALGKALPFIGIGLAGLAALWFFGRGRR